MSGILYITSTPIGNLEDITFRALRILKEADFIACEDTRVSIKLLNRFDIHTPMVSYHKFSSEKETENIINKIKEGENCALITDAGTPCISDPGCRLIKIAIDEGIKVETVPGACAFISALTLSGFDTQKGFLFAGFPPRKQNELTEFIANISKYPYPIGIYEAPNRIKDTLEIINKIMPERPLSLSRELTKIHEETLRGTGAEILNILDKTEIKGEIVLIIEAASPEIKTFSPQEAINIINECINKGMSEKDAIKQTSAQTDIPKNKLYKLFLDSKK